MLQRVAHQQALWYEEELNKEIEKDRLAHGKKPLKKKDDNQPPASGGTGNDKDSISEELLEDVKTQKCSTSDPESGWFRKGEHKHVFAYAVETACDKHGWILGYTVHPGNEHDSRTFKSLYDKISKLNPQMMVADAGYGLLILIGSIVALKVFNLDDSQKQFAKFFMYLSIPTIIFGFIYGSFFGDFINLDGVKLIDPSKDVNTILVASIVFGVIQIFFGLGIKAYVLIRDGRPLDALYDVGSWVLTLVSIGVFAMGSG